MKNTIKKLNYYLLLFTALIFISCERDLYDEAIQKDKNILVKNISLSELSRKDNAKLFSSVDEVRNKKKNIQGKIVYDSINDIYFDDQSGKYIEREDGYKSYTFPILKYGSGDKKIENIVFSLNEIGEYDVFKAKYDFTKEEMENLTKQEMESQNVIYTGISQGKLGQIVCINTVKWISYPIDEGNNEGNFGYTGEWVATSYHCYNMADNTGGFAGGGGDTDGPIDAPSNSGTSGGQSGGGSISTTPIALTPNQAGMAAFMHDFNDKQLDWYNNQNDATLNSITNYLVQNDFSPESEDFIYQMITACAINGSTFIIDSNVNNSNAQVFNNLSEFQSNLNNINETGFDFNYLNDGTERTARAKIQLLGPAGGIIISIKQKMTPPPYSILDVTSSTFGFTISFGFQQTSFNSSIVSNIATVNVFGNLHYNCVIDGLGTVWSTPKHYIIKINITTGNIISIVPAP